MYIWISIANKLVVVKSTSGAKATYEQAHLIGPVVQVLIEIIIIDI